MGSPLNQNSHTVEEAVKLMEKDPSINFEFEGELNPEVALSKAKLDSIGFSRLKNEANILVMPDKHSAGISVGLLKAIGGLDVIGTC